jgi:hypothetical protein
LQLYFWWDYAAKAREKKLSFLIIGHLFKVRDASMTVCELWALFFKNHSTE